MRQENDWKGCQFCSTSWLVVNVIDRLGHVRLYSISSLVTPWEGRTALHWKEALRPNAAYNPEKDERFTCAAIHLFMLAWTLWRRIWVQRRRCPPERIRFFARDERTPQYILPRCLESARIYVYDDRLTWLSSTLAARDSVVMFFSACTCVLWITIFECVSVDMIRTTESGRTGRCHSF